MKNLQRKLTANVKVSNGFIRFHKEVAQWLGVWIDTHLTGKEHHNCCMKKARAAEVGLRVFTRMHGISPVWVRAVQIACVQAVALSGSEH